MHGAEVLIPITLFLSGSAMIFGIVYMHKRENLAMIEKGMNPKEWSNRPAPYKNLKWGLLLVGSGVGLLLAYLIDQMVLTGRASHDPEGLYFALVAIGGGSGLIASYRVEKKELLDRKQS